MKIALGLFHFNLDYIKGDLDSSHRYCLQVVIPFTRLLLDKPSYRMSWEIAGSGLEFLAEHYPEGLEMLRHLVNKGQIELISPLYIPGMWPAFPLRDIEKSISINAKLLQTLGLTPSRIFFSQEGFFGPGLAALDEKFSIFVCKDDYLRYFDSSASSELVYRIGGSLAVVGSNHLANALRARYAQPKEGRAVEITLRLRARLKPSTDSGVSLESAERKWTSYAGHEVHWYHMGCAHQFMTPTHPHERDAFFADPEWIGLNCTVLDELIGEGTQLSTIEEFVKLAAPINLPPFPDIVEGSWNADQSLGLRAWMGRHNHQWEDDPTLLGLLWKARSALRRSEIIMQELPNEFRTTELEDRIEAAWKLLIVAQGSDTFGWSPLQSEVRSGRRTIELALAAAGSLESAQTYQRHIANTSVTQDEMVTQPVRELCEPMLEVKLLGGHGQISCQKYGKDFQLLDVQFVHTHEEAGIAFGCKPEQIAYCRTGEEQTVRRIAWEASRQDAIYLPLANGYLKLDEDCHIIRLNEYGQVAVHVSRLKPWAAFTVDGATRGRSYHWRFIIFRGEDIDAVALANIENFI